MRLGKTGIALFALFSAAGSGNAQGLEQSAAKIGTGLSEDIGPEPDFRFFREAAEQRLKSSMYDPDSARFEWPYELTRGFFKPSFGKRAYGWWTCGTLNGKNRLGGYVGARYFVVVARYGQIIMTEMEREGASEMARGCAVNAPAARKNLPDSGEAITTLGARPVFGFDWSVVSEGAYVTKVAPGTPAERAKLVAGMVVSHVNGLSIKGFQGAAIAQIFGAIEEEGTFTVLGGQKVAIARSPAGR